MTHTSRLFITISAVSACAFSFLVVAKDSSGGESAGSDQSATPSRGDGDAGGPRLFGQGARNSDVAVVDRIRKGITGSKNLSANARNVKVITTGGRVVLEGAVISAEEKHLIGDIAIGVQGRDNVTNQLAIRSAPSAPTGLRVIEIR